ncbi:part of a binding-protein-dependent transport system [Arthrobacter sp. Hiyo4]|nr:part of a binding-protein-dependent transport system [Arthrobacter sp. Hiyo4]
MTIPETAPTIPRGHAERTTAGGTQVPASPPAPARRRRTGRRLSARRALIYTILIVAVAATLLPFVWMLLGAFKTEASCSAGPSPGGRNSPPWITLWSGLPNCTLARFF